MNNQFPESKIMVAIWKTAVDLQMILKITFEVKSKVSTWRRLMTLTTFIELISRYPEELFILLGTPGMCKVPERANF